VAEPIQPGEVARLSARVRRITAPNPGPMTGPGTNTYLVGDDEVFIIDPGPETRSHLEAVADAANGRAEAILVTHAHPDHADGARAMAERLGVPVYAHSIRLQGIRTEGFAADRHLAEGDRLAGPDFHLRTLHTPGHAADHLCFLLEEEGMLLAGDHVMEAVTVVIAPPDGDMAAYLASLERLKGEPIETIALAYGHLTPAPARVFGYVLAPRLAPERRLLAALGEEPRTIDSIVPEVYTDVPQAMHPVAAWQVSAHLRKLEAETAVAVSDAGWRRL